MGRPAHDSNNPEAEQFRKLFIGGLDYRTTDQSLKSFFEQWGEIVDVVVMKHPQTQKSRGFGFVTYAKSAMVDEAMKNRPHKIDGREVDSKRAVPRDESGQQLNANVNVKKMFVGSIKEQSESDLRAYFSTFGTIVSVNIVMDKLTGKRKGYAFIEYDDYDPVDKALLRKDHAVDGKSVTVKKAVVKESGGAGGGRGGQRSGGRGARSAPTSAWAGSASQWSGGANGYGGPWDTQGQGNGWGAQSWDQYGAAGKSSDFERIVTCDETMWIHRYMPESKKQSLKCENAQFSNEGKVQNQAAGGGWNTNGYAGYGGSGGGPVRNSYSSQGRSAPYGGGYNSSSSWGGNGRY